MFFSTLVISFIVSSVSAAGIMLIKAVFRKQLTAKWHYNMWFLLLAALTLPFIPGHWLSFGMLYSGFEGNLHYGIGGMDAYITGSGAQEPGQANWLQDFTVSVHRGVSPWLKTAAAAVWFAGMLVMAALTVHSWFKIKQIRKRARRLADQAVLDLLNQCKQQLHMDRELIVLESPLVKSPMIFGLFKTYLVFPVRFAEWLSMDEIKYIILHELNHLKNRDNVTNYWIVAFQLIYWFNPLIWIAFKQMRLDREIACDIAVLHTLDDRCRAEYGNTIINVADRASRPMNFALTSQLVSRKSQIKARIETIAGYRAESKRLKLTSAAVVLLAGVFVTSQIPFVSALALGNEQRYDFAGERTVYEDLSGYFAGYEGAFVLYDMQADQYRIYNERTSTRRVSPDSTYKIYSALIGLESGAISSSLSEIEWNGEKYPYEEWNKDHNLFTAMRTSVNWYFQSMESRIDRSRLQAYVHQIHYGNADISGGPEPYWLESSLKISPVEQVQLLKSLYTNDFGFREEHIRTVQQAIRLEDKGEAQLFGKTGTGAVNGQNINGWFVGYVERNGNTYFFAANIQSGSGSSGSTAAEIALKILKDKGIY